ncbi:MAG: ribonuclease HI family protein [Deltaproteobacteria bacterium]|nr:ribonuclease HI family protein [Deltaproteobacteria bacterium]
MGEQVKFAEVFRALAEGGDLARVRERFGLTQDQLQAIFQDAADYYYTLEEGTWSLYSDGASRGNPGQAGVGVVLVDPYGQIAVRNLKYLGQATNNVAEYRGLLLGLEMARNLGIKKIQIYSDSELLVRQINGAYRVKKPHLLALWQQARRELQQFESFEVIHVPRELNREADRLANQAIDQRPPPR